MSTQIVRARFFTGKTPEEACAKVDKLKLEDLGEIFSASHIVQLDKEFGIIIISREVAYKEESI